jgi:hypothetical protein
MPRRKFDHERRNSDVNRRNYVPTGEDINHYEEVKHQHWWTNRPRGDGKRILQALSPKSAVTRCSPVKGGSAEQSTTPDVVDVERTLGETQRTTKKRKRARPSRRVRQRLLKRLARTKDKGVEEEFQRLEGLKARKFGVATVNLLSGAVPEKLSLSAGSLMSKTHRDGCNADMYVGGGLSKKRKEIRPRFSSS